MCVRVRVRGFGVVRQADSFADLLESCFAIAWCYISS